MVDKEFRAYVVFEDSEGNFKGEIRTRNTSDLPPGDVLIRVHYSSLNYKDALSASGNRGVTREFPHTPGIDASGVVERSNVSEFNKEDKVIVTSYDLGMNTPGGWAEYVQVPAEWVVSLPTGLSLKESMFYGTAGFTAGLAFKKLLKHGVEVDHGLILVSGASGGLGSIALALLSNQGYMVTAVTGKEESRGYLESLGVKNIISRDEAIDKSNKPMLSAKWAGVIDPVGGEILATAIKKTVSRGVIVSCGNAASANLDITVYPFILRGISLVGVDSQNAPMETRKEIWSKLASEWKLKNIDKIGSVCTLEDISEEVRNILEGKQIGRRVISLVEG